MAPKEKAKDLLVKMHIENDLFFIMSNSQAKKAALKTIKEISYLCNKLKNYEQAVYWKAVREELLKL